MEAVSLSTSPRPLAFHPARGIAWWSIVGLALLILGVWLLATDVPGWNTLWYLFGWYGWLLLLDGAWLHPRGRSFVAGRRRELAAMMLCSIPFWYLYEAYDLRLLNWYYVFVLHDDRQQFLVSLVAFATVFPACLLHAELFAGSFASVRWRPRQVTRRTQALWLSLGVLSTVAPLLWPRWAFALVWGLTLWLPDLAAWRIGAPSLLGDLAAGRPQRLLRLLCGGMVAGLVWESLNYWARCKWIYTVPFFDRLKLFEMPLLGFLGFPVLALGVFSTWSWLRSRRWRALPAWTLLVVAGVALFSCIAIYRQMLDHTVRSRRPLLADLRGLDAAAIRSLERVGIASPERLERAVAERGLDSVATSAGLERGRLAEAARHAALAVHKGMGSRMASALLELGVVDVGDLGRRDPGELWAAVQRAPSVGGAAPRREEVDVWVAAARDRDRPRR